MLFRLLRKYKESINPPYSKKDIPAIIFFFFIFFSLIFTAFFLRFRTNLESLADNPRVFEIEQGTVLDAIVTEDPSASGGQYIQFPSD